MESTAELSVNGCRISLPGRDASDVAQRGQDDGDEDDDDDEVDERRRG